jgi:antitoxin MazE
MIYILTNVYQEAIMQVSKWGNSLAIRLPASVVRVAGTGTFEVERTPSREEWLKRLRRFRGVIPADFKFDRDEANAR